MNTYDPYTQCLPDKVVTDGQNEKIASALFWFMSSTLVWIKTMFCFMAHDCNYFKAI